MRIGFFAAYRAATVRFLRGFMIQYPYGIAKLASNIPTTSLPLFHDEMDLVRKDDLHLKIAVGHMVFRTKCDWNQTFGSHEEHVSLHRWNWLLRSVNGNELASLDDGINLVRSYLTEVGVSPKGDASESYTVGERISNMCLFTRHKTSNWHSVPADIQEALRFKAKFLAHRLEYLPGNLTGNHLINNARALLFAGHCCDLEEAKIISRSILASHLKTLINNEGFLREGSSHYQFLITRWLLELRLIAEELNDTETFDIIKDFLPRMVKACKFFLVETSNYQLDMVLFGDISPDCEPSWLIGLTNSPLAQFGRNTASKNLVGWAGLFKDFISQSDYLWPFSSSTEFGWAENIKSDWRRLDYRNWVAIWHVSSPSGAPIASHAHYDFGSPVVYFKGKEVLIDVGRLEYENTEMSNYGLLAQAHSSLTVNGLSMVLSRRDHRIPEFHRNAETHIWLEKGSGWREVTISHDGFNRIGGNIGRHIRKFIFTKDRLEISDLVQGSGAVLFETFFQFPKLPKNIEIPFGRENPCAERMDMEFKSNSTLLKLCTFICSKDPIGGWRFKTFGIRNAAVTLKLSAMVELPFESKYEIFKE